MATTLKFRPVVFGPLAHPTMVFSLIRGKSGETWIREFEGARPLAVALEAATVEDLPPHYREGGRTITLLPVQQVSAPSEAEAFERMQDVLHALHLRGMPQARSA